MHPRKQDQWFLSVAYFQELLKQDFILELDLTFDCEELNKVANDETQSIDLYLSYVPIHRYLVFQSFFN